MFDALPEAFGSYRVLEAIGPGRFGPIYRGQEGSTGLFVAIKVFDQGLTPDQASRLAATLQKLGQEPLNHPAIAPVLAADALNDRVWLAEPWLEAIPLDAIMQREGRLPLSDILVVITNVAAALDFAAAVGIHHGALHPRDVLVGKDQTFLAGIGVLQALSEAGLIVPMKGAYISPQRAEGLPVSRGDDIFSLAAIAYELVYESPVPPRSELRAAAIPPPGLDRSRFAHVLERALSPEAGDRPSTALAFAAGIQEAVVPVPPLETDADIPIHESRPQAAVADLPLRASAVEAVRNDSHVLEPEPAPEPANRDREPEPGYGLWFSVAATLAIGLLMGFAGGYVVGQRDATPVPHSAERPVVRNQPADETAPTAGRDYTESTVPPADKPAPRASQGPQAVTEQPVMPPPESSGRTQQLDDGVLQVDSRPRGARVFVDGRLVGTTPVVVSAIKPGSHAVRIDLRGHRRWVTSVDVAPGERQRVAASLER